MTRCSLCHKLTTYTKDGVCIMCHTEPKRKYQRVKKINLIIAGRVRGVDLPMSYYR
jgi:hypothetical protein